MEVNRVHLTLLALAALAPAARWWGKYPLEIHSDVHGRRACDWVKHLGNCVVTDDVFGPHRDEARARVSCPACLVMLDWALENS